MTEISLTRDQIRAITSLEGPLFVAAGAGSGKTGVVTRRFVHAIASGYANVDQILTITFTKKAAAEMMWRIRQLLREPWVLQPPANEAQRERMSRAYRQIERAHISTIDSFCSSLLRAHALAAGIDPNFRTLDQSQAQVVREEAFDVCLKRFVEKHGAAATEMISAYDPNLAGDLFNAITGVYDGLRSQGCEPTLPVPTIRLEEAEERLRAAIAGVRAAVGGLDSPSKTQLNGLDQAAALESALNAPEDLTRYQLIEGAKLKGNFTRVAEEFGELAKARDCLLNEIRSLRAKPTLALLNDLLETFASEYETEKNRRGSLDFGDLSVKTRNLLREKENVRKNIASRYRLIMVDEFQDTNELQYDIFKLISDNNLCLVGDENQSIYGFRDAVVELFQERKEEARKGGCLVELVRNYRSQPEILAFVDHIFDREGMLRPGYMKLTPSAEPDGQEEDRRVEVVFVDERRNSQSEGLERAPREITRKAEAHIIAHRLKDLSDSGYELGGIAVLVRKAGQADVYRDALQRVGIESYLSVGRSYFEKLELSDVVNMLRLIINPLDDLAMIGALRSPMAGISDDALYHLREAARDDAGKLPLHSAIMGAGGIAGMSDADQIRLDRFAGGLIRLRQSARRESLEATCRRIINFNDFVAITAARSGGKQKLANLLKLLDMAADFEESWGAGLHLFTEFLQRQKHVEAKEAEAPTEEEGIKAVRFLTMHGAKGLEFPLVVLPDLGAAPGGRNSKIILVDRHGVRVGLKYVANSPFDGPAFEYDILADENRQAELREEKRLGYVAMTRAQGHLLVSGAAPADRPPSAERKTEPPFDWLRNRLSLCWPRNDSLGEIDCLEDVNGTQVGIDLCLEPEAKAEEFNGAAALLTEKPLQDVNHGIARIPPPSVYVPSTISPTAIDTFATCPRRYYLERVLSAWHIFDEIDKEAGIHRTPQGPRAVNDSRLRTPIVPDSRKGENVNGISSRDLGTLVHALLERARPPLTGAAGLTDDYLDEIAATVLPPGMRLTAADRQKAATLVANLGKTQIGKELDQAASEGRLYRELSFSTMLGRTILKGQIDALALKETGSLVVDYKTGNHLGQGNSCLEPAAAYTNQMAAYALAAARSKPGPVEVVLVFLDDPVEEIRMSYSEAQINKLEQELKDKVEAMSDGQFAPAAFDRRACSQCFGNNTPVPLCPAASAGRRA